MAQVVIITLIWAKRGNFEDYASDAWNRMSDGNKVDFQKKVIFLHCLFE